MKNITLNDNGSNEQTCNSDPLDATNSRSLTIHKLSAPHPTCTPLPPTASLPETSSETLSIQSNCESSNTTPPVQEISSPICVNPCSSVVENSDAVLLDDLASFIRRFVILPPHAAETLALWVLHTYAFKLRDISTYIGIESPDKGCGKTTLLRVLGKLVYKPVSTANVSPSALFRVIEELQPTLLIDEGDTFLRNNDELRGILNAGYTPDTAFVLRASSESSSPVLRSLGEGGSSLSTSNQNSVVASPKLPPLHDSTTPAASGFRRFSTWCPKAIAMIGRLPDTLGDRCIIIRMQKKSRDQKCERLRDLDVATLPARCEAFAKAHADVIAQARPATPAQLGDRAADIWEPLFALADLAGAAWPEQARKAAISTSLKAQQESPIGSLLADLAHLFAQLPEPKRIFTRDLVHHLNSLSDRPWSVLAKGKPITDLWLSATLRPYGITSKTMWVNGKAAKGYDYEDCGDLLKRNLPSLPNAS